MTFTKMTNRLYAAKDMGFVFDQTAPREVDEKAINKMMSRVGERFVDDKIDEFYDMDGDVYLGDDGNFYAVLYSYYGPQEHQYVPTIWQRIVHPNGDVALDELVMSM